MSVSSTNINIEDNTIPPEIILVESTIPEPSSKGVSDCCDLEKREVELNPRFDYDSANTQSVAAPFESDILSEIIKKKEIPVRSQTDSAGRAYYHFREGIDDVINNSATIVVFDVLGKKLVNISSTILRLDTLLSLKQCIHHKPTGSKPFEQIELRSTPIPASWFGSIECTFENTGPLVIDNMSIDMMINIVSHLSRIYGKSLQTNPAD